MSTSADSGNEKRKDLVWQEQRLVLIFSVENYEINFGGMPDTVYRQRIEETRLKRSVLVFPVVAEFS